MGRKLDQIKLGESSEKLQYVVTPPDQSRPFCSESDLGMDNGEEACQSSSHCESDTVEFLVVNDDLILQRRKTHVASTSQPDLIIASSRECNLSSGKAREGTNIKRRVSRVESLRTLFFNRAAFQNNLEAKKRFLLKKRTRSEEKCAEKVKIKIFVCF